MSEEKLQDVNNQESVAPETVSEDQGPEKAAQPTDVSTEPAKGSKEYNWRQMERKNEQLENQIKELMRKDEERNRPTPPPEEDVLSTLEKDDIITVEQAERLAAKKAEELINQTLAKRERASLPDRTRKQYSDFDSIMTEENIKKLETEEPGLADACAKATNPWEATYKILKKFVTPANDEKIKKAEEKLNDNYARPASSNSVGRKGPLADANAWANASKDELYKEMMQAAKKAR